MELKDITLSIVVPCYNEKNNIKSIIDKVLEIENINKEIIVVDDFSQDGTREILENEIAPLVSNGNIENNYSYVRNISLYEVGYFCKY